MQGRGTRKRQGAMGRKLFVAAAVAAVLIGLVGGVASAQVANKATFQVPFSFTVGGKEMPAGKYEWQVLGSGVGAVTIRNADTGQTTLVKAMTRLADPGGSEPQIVFDKVENVRYLSEVHFPGIDGFEIAGAPGEHSHESVPAKK